MNHKESMKPINMTSSFVGAMVFTCVLPSIYLSSRAQLDVVSNSLPSHHLFLHEWIQLFGGVPLVQNLSEHIIEHNLGFEPRQLQRNEPLTIVEQLQLLVCRGVDASPSLGSSSGGYKLKTTIEKCKNCKDYKKWAYALNLLEEQFDAHLLLLLMCSRQWSWPLRYRSTP